MTPRSIALGAGIAVVAAAALVSTAVPAAGASTPDRTVRPVYQSSSVKHHTERTCATAARGHAACLARVVTNSAGKPVADASPSGYGPADIEAAYGLGGAAGAGQTVAIVDAYDDPTAESDLASYRSTYGLSACTTANGCFSKIDEDGGTSYPATDAGWATEISLDLDMVSSACPSCNILLVEADSSSFADLGTAVDTAADDGAAAISNSYGGSDTASSADYDHPGIAVTASTGDDGYGVESPASYDTVIAVGGTSLDRSGSGFTQTAWSGAGSGCSSDNATPAWQTSATQCSGKATADVSAVADPNTGVAVYDTTPYDGSSGWQVYGGTSASSPIIASAYAMGGNHGESYPAAYTWANTGSLTDVTSGSNGSCTTAVWCNSGAGWDGPTGLGTPNGTGAF